jgi:hypothetical protein
VEEIPVRRLPLEVQQMHATVRADRHLRLDAAVWRPDQRDALIDCAAALGR